MRDLLNYVRAGYTSDVQENALFSVDRNSLRAAQIAAYPGHRRDRGRKNDTAYEFRAAFLDDRYRFAVARRTHTLFAMNGDPAELPGDLYDRMRDGRFVIFHNRDASMHPMMV